MGSVQNNPRAQRSTVRHVINPVFSLFSFPVEPSSNDWRENIENWEV